MRPPSDRLPRWKRQRCRRQLWRRLALGSLALWACVLSVESLVRRPGFAPSDALPSRLQVDGELEERRQASALPGGESALKGRELPSGVVELGAARYGNRHLLLLGLSRGGSSGVMPVEAINAVLTGSSQGGSCLVVDPRGEVRAELTNESQWLAWRRNNPITPVETLKWLAGLRPRQTNLCLWSASSTRSGEG